MATVIHKVALTTAPVQINTPPTDSRTGSALAFYNRGAGSVWYGHDSASADSNDGIEVPSGSWSPGIELDPGDEIWASSASTSDIRIHESGI